MSQEIEKENWKYFELNNKNQHIRIRTKLMLDGALVVLRGKVIALNVYVRKEKERSKMLDLGSYLHNLGNFSSRNNQKDRLHHGNKTPRSHWLYPPKLIFCSYFLSNGNWIFAHSRHSGSLAGGLFNCTCASVQQRREQVSDHELSLKASTWRWHISLGKTSPMATPNFKEKREMQSYCKPRRKRNGMFVNNSGNLTWKVTDKT